MRDYARGELVCDSCGLVISESAIDEGPEWAAYSVEENDRLARTGAPRSYVAGASGLTTVIPLANKDARGNTIPLREREKFYRMRKLQRHSGHSRPGERSLPETIRSLDRVASLMGLPRPVKDEAGFICKKALEKGLVRDGRSRRSSLRRSMPRAGSTGCHGPLTNCNRSRESARRRLERRTGLSSEHWSSVSRRPGRPTTSAASVPASG